VMGEAFHTQTARKPQTSDFWVAIIEFPASGPEVCGIKISRTSGIGGLRDHGALPSSTIRVDRRVSSLCGDAYVSKENGRQQRTENPLR
jgi:hypothetical protein